MFYKNQTIHHPDSPREMNTAAWLANKHVCARNEKINLLQQMIDIDLSLIDDQVAEGIVYCTCTDNRIEIVYKQAPGMYVQQGFVSGSIEIPLPELYVYAHLSVVRRDGAYRVSTEKMRIASPHRLFLPISNVYSSERDFPYTGYRGRGTAMCAGDAIDALIGEQQHINDIPTAFATIIKNFLLAHGNADLDLSHNDDSERTLSGQLIGYKFRLDSPGSERRNRCEEYEAYWCFLHYVSRTRTPEQVYQLLQRCDTVSEAIDAFDVDVNEFKQFQQNVRRNEVVVLYR